MKKYFVTTSIPYANSSPHIGYGMELVQADCLARYFRSKKLSTFLSTGTDEHGLKISEKASSLGLKPKQFTDNVSQEFKDLAKSLNINYDAFIRTTDQAHQKRCQAIWQLMLPDIYKSIYVGWYCVGDEAFFTETEVQANNGICPNHNRPFEKLEEENYFFKLSKYQDQIKEQILNHKMNIFPDSRANEILSLIEQGLDDISISRPKDKISWGIDVPGDDSQTMYVWFEALLNYLTVIGYPDDDNYKNYWPAKAQVLGKDILRFHAAIWPAMLLSLGLDLPENLYVHGFVTLNNQKISKSLGNVISADEITENYGIDAFRYYFLRHIPSYADGDFNWDHFKQTYQNELANELGNAVQRTVVLIDKYFADQILEFNLSTHDRANYDQYMSSFRFDRALDLVWSQVRGLNQYIDETKPWLIAKENDLDHLKEVLVYQGDNLLEIADLLNCFMPQTAQMIKKIFTSQSKFRKILFPKVD